MLIVLGLTFFIFRAKVTHSRQITTSQLSYHILALMAAYENPRNFHGINLVAVLEKHMAHHMTYSGSSAYEYSLGLMALCASGVAMRESHVTKLAKMQRKDGSFSNGLGKLGLVLLSHLQ